MELFSFTITSDTINTFTIGLMGAICFISFVIPLIYTWFEKRNASSELQSLPKQWYNLWKACLNYPASRMLFVEHVFDFDEITERLTPQQATFIAESLGRNEQEVGFFANDMSRFVEVK